MFINLDKCELPIIYKRNNRDCYLDPIRKKLIYITPEETVRQKVISYLMHELKVPANMILVEEHLSHYGVESSKRADIVVHRYDDELGLIPIAVIECKAPDVFLGERALNQMLDYCDALSCDYAMMVNGFDAFCYRFNEDKNQYVELENLPVFTDMIEGKHIVIEKGAIPERIPFEEYSSYLNEQRDNFDGDYYFCDISPQSEMNIAIPAFNLWECLLDCRVKIPLGQYKAFKIIEDYGIRMLDYGNASGGTFFGPYRSFLIDVNGSTEFVSFCITTYWKGNNTDNVKTCLAVAIDNEKTTHHALQLVLDDNLKTNENVCIFSHHGRIAVGKMGSGKISELKNLVTEKYPEIISGNKFVLGTLINNKLWKLDDPDVISLIENLITYSLIRDEYRELVKARN